MRALHTALLPLVFAACTPLRDIEPTTLADHTTPAATIRVNTEHGSGVEEGDGPHTMTVSLTLGGLPCVRLDGATATFNGQPAAFSHLGPLQARGEACGGDDIPYPVFTSASLPRDLIADIEVVLTDGTTTWSATAHPPDIFPLPAVADLRAVGPTALVTATDGFETGGRLVVYPGVSYELDMDHAWLEEDRNNDALEQVERFFVESRELIEDYAFAGEQIALGPRDFVLRTRHLLSVECTSDSADCLTVDGFGPSVFTAYRWLNDTTEQLSMTWAELGEVGHVCRTDNSCDDDATCTEAICTAP